ncbi:hypothetical protein PanWU01x14_342440 [Parasponia andersonii]|uniref:Uncharacterized protein n=1 Tax=Parasponia andersonii TaxID=3476 RepID=A0A2P5ADT7_PARAD|nr:hypothetical protein PanWU01x14_342440 [Parasponia andersonii]
MECGQMVPDKQAETENSPKKKKKKNNPNYGRLPNCPIWVRATPNVSKSVSVLDLSGKEKSAKPPRRLSIPAKYAASSAPRLASSITPISEARGKRSDNIQRKTETPVSDVSRVSNRKKFSVLSSSSYWLSQIKLSEASAKHSISLGFFKLALEAGCEPLQRMGDELTSYARRHNLIDFGDPLKELFESYNIVESTGQLQISESCSQVPEEGSRSSDDEIRSSSSAVSTRNLKLKPKVSNSDAAQVSPFAGSTKKNTTQKTNPPAARIRGSLTKDSANLRSLSATGANNKSLKKPQKPSKQEVNKEKDLIKKKGKKSADEQGMCPVSPSCAGNALQENKENMDASSMEEISLTEVM